MLAHLIQNLQKSDLNRDGGAIGSGETINTLSPPSTSTDYIEQQQLTTTCRSGPNYFRHTQLSNCALTRRQRRSTSFVTTQGYGHIMYDATIADLGQ